VIAAVLEREPQPVSSLQAMAPAGLDRIVKTCLRKDRETRWQSAHDLKEEIVWIAEGDTRTWTSTRGRRYGWLLWLAGLGLTGAALFALGYFSHETPPAHVVRLTLPAPPGAAFTISSSVAGSVSVSPNGQLVAFAAQRKEGAGQLWIRPIDSLTARPLAGTEEGFAPFWSPDSRWLGFFSHGKLKKVEVTGGPVETLCDAPLGRGGTWSRDGRILFAPNLSQPLFEIAATGGSARPLTEMEASRQEVTHRWPAFLPDGEHYLFFIRTAAQASTGVYAGTLGSNEHRLLISSGTNAVYAEPGYLLFGRGDVLVAQPFDAKHLQVHGAPVQVAQDVSMMPATNFGNFSASRTGTLVYISGAIELGRGLYWYDRHGTQIGKLGSPEYASWPQLSPDGKRLALRLWTQPAGNFEIWVYDLARSVHARESFSALTAFAAVWSPDGTQLAYSHSSPQVSGDHIYLLNPDGRGTEQPLEQPFLESIANYPSSWSPDGASLLFDRQDKSGKISVWIMPMSGKSQAVPVHGDAVQRTNGAIFAGWPVGCVRFE
jgi:Tol biopolymer transport system component